MTHFVSWPLRGTAVFPSSPEVVLFVDCNAWYVFVLPSLQMDGGLPGWGVASNNRAGGGAEKRRLSGQTGQLLCAADSFPQEDLRPWADTVQGENMQMFMHLSFIYCNLLLWASDVIRLFYRRLVFILDTQTMSSSGSTPWQRRDCQR